MNTKKWVLCAHMTFHRVGFRVCCDECNQLYDVSVPYEN